MQLTHPRSAGMTPHGTTPDQNDAPAPNDRTIPPHSFGSGHARTVNGSRTAHVHTSQRVFTLLVALAMLLSLAFCTPVESVSAAAIPSSLPQHEHAIATGTLLQPTNTLVNDATKPLYAAHKTVQRTDPQRYLWPTGKKALVIRGFSVGEHNWLPGHRGVDLDLNAGQPVFAARAGTVLYAGILVDRHVVSIEHDDGIRTTYEPVNPSLSVGEHVHAGQQIGTLEPGHCLLGDCLHFGAKRGKDDYLNPLFLLHARHIRLYE
ncbi:MAG: M23 family metallopeptidase [Actinomycetaceae bacterium]|nr:M23 family metallopeptidase [Actinomycetaceae bacterium]